MNLSRTRALKLFLLAVKQSPDGLTMSWQELADYLLLSTRGVAYLTKRLEAEGLISISREAGKSNTYTLTPKFKFLLEA